MLLLIPVSLIREGEDSLGSTAPGHQAASPKIKSSSLTAFFDEILNGYWLDDRIVPQGCLLLQNQFLGRVCSLNFTLKCHCSLLGLGDSYRWLRSAIAEMGMFQSADVFTYSENKNGKVNYSMDGSASLFAATLIGYQTFIL